jgi:hypothetical protein
MAGVERLPKIVHKSGVDHSLHESSSYGDWNAKLSILIIHQDISLPVKEMERLPHLRYAFLGDAPELPESLAAKKISFTEWKNGTQTPQRANCTIVDNIGDSANLLEAIMLFSGEKPLPESIVLTLPDLWKWKSEMHIRKGEEKNWDEYADDMLYFFSNDDKIQTIRIPAKPIEGWFSLQELKGGREFGKDDRAFFMDWETGKIGEAAVRKNAETGKLEVRIKMEPKEYLIVRIVRERVRYSEGVPTGIGFMEFETLPKWEYGE